MAQHVKILGVLHIVFGCLGILAAVVAAGHFRRRVGLVGVNDHTQDSLVAIPILGGIGGIFVFVIVLVVSLPGLISGIGLMQFRPWARILAIILSALDLFNIPFGTALGVYGFWVLLNRETEQLFGLASAPMAPRV